MIRLLLPLPPSTNHLYRRTETGMQVLQGSVKRFRAEVMACLMEQWPGQGGMPPAPYRVTVHLVHGDKRRHDVDNSLKSLLDSLTAALGFDDNDITEIHATKCYERGRSECVVTIEPAA